MTTAQHWIKEKRRQEGKKKEIILVCKWITFFNTLVIPCNYIVIL